jgi:cytochrome c-type biogenesis protein
MLPIYLSYFAGGGARSASKTLRCALGFVVGFSVVFVAMGALAGSIGSFLSAQRRVVDLLCGAVVVIFGLNYLGVLNLNLFSGSRRQVRKDNMTFLSALVFGLVFALGWTPCVGAFLGSALMLASQQGHTAQGMGMLLAYSLGLGIPFLLSAVLIDSLKGAFGWIKAHYRLINTVCGLLLVAIGLLMMSGWMNRLLAVLS